ncbi:MAG: hypothetical protein JXA46_08195 [Dehalococcoidales bacterium]|nr:hypothetical protein [Dehalococcoidales bacterium]
MERNLRLYNMDDNIWEYPFGDIDDDEDIYYRRPDCGKKQVGRPVRGDFYI